MRSDALAGLYAPKTARLRRAVKRNPLHLLERARFHLLFGSDPPFSRDAEPGDVAAAEILSRLENEVMK